MIIIKTHVIPFLMTALFLTGCKNSINLDKSTLPYYIDLENDLDRIKSIPLSILGSKLEYIPLETNPECLVKSVNKITVTDSFIVVCDYSLGLLLFDITGKYLRQIGKNGRGPGEYPRVNDFIVDNNQKEIYVLSSRKVDVYDFNGQFKRDFQLVDFPCSQIIMDENDDLIIHPWNTSQPTANPVYSWYIYDKRGTVRTKIINTLKRVNGGVEVPMSPLYMYNGTLHYMEYGIDTLYNYSNNEKIPYAIFYCGKKKQLIDPTLSEAIIKNDKIWVSDIKETNDLLLVRVWMGSRTILNCVFNKSTSVFAVLKENRFTNDIDDGLSFWPKKIINDNLMVDCIDALDLITYAKNNQTDNNKQRNRLKEIAEQLSETSNPVVIILKN